MLTELGIRLIDIHSQHQNLNLSNSLFQMKVLDSFAQSASVLSAYRNQYFAFREKEKKFLQLQEEASKSKTELDYLHFQYVQLEEAKLKDGEQEDLEQELERLSHAEEIKTALTNAASVLQGDGMSVLQLLKDSHSNINRISRFLHGNENMASRIDTAYIEIKDIAHEIEMINNQLYFDPERLVTVNERLNVIYNLEKKHRLSSLSELIELRDNLKEKISTINSYDAGLADLEKELEESLTLLKKQGAMLSETRSKAVKPFENHVVSMLREVGIPNAGFNIHLQHSDEFTSQGADSIQFLFSANKNLKPQEISRVASGGEISRLMLCIKSLMSDSAGLPTIIFDEIDTGVSGEIAERVGNIISRMAEKMQIINITHLPQVASKGKYHYLVYKSDEGKTSVTNMKLLSDNERHVEIAKMLSGEEVTAAALENARALLGK
jgi:DNA repair protein RecN (Recombination protein N)